MSKKIVTVLDLLPAEAMPEIDRLGYSFLASAGYDTENAEKDAYKRRRIRRRLEKNGEELRYRGAFDRESGAILVWFELYRGEEKVMSSTGMKFLPIEGKREGG